MHSQSPDLILGGTMSKILVSTESARTLARAHVPAGTAHTPARLQCGTTGTCSLICMAPLLEKKKKKKQREIVAARCYTCTPFLPRGLQNHWHQSRKSISHSPGARMHEKEAPRKKKKVKQALSPLLLVAWQKALTTSQFKTQVALQISFFRFVLRKVANLR